MYVSVCTVAGGSSGNEILFPCQIKASAPISVAVELGGCAHNARKGMRTGERWTRMKTCRGEGRDSNQRLGLYRQAEWE